MKKSLLTFVFALLSFSSFAQFKFVEEPYTAPKGAVNLNGVKSDGKAKLKLGQLAYYTWEGRRDTDVYALRTDDDAEANLTLQDTRIYIDPKTGMQYVTFQWVGKNKGKAKITIESEINKNTEKEEKKSRVIFITIK